MSEAEKMKWKNKMFDTNYHYNQQEITNPEEIWPPNTVLLVGDSMLNQLDQDRLSTSTNKLVKVRSYGGAGINTIYTKLDGLLKKRLNYIILHVGANDDVNKSSEIILNDLLQLKNHIEQKAPEIMVYLSCPINTVDNGKARITIQKLVEKIEGETPI